MLTLALTVCLMTNPSHCEDRHIPLDPELVSLVGCQMGIGAASMIATWAQEHPKWTVARWRCEIITGEEDA